ncbi:MAG: hypothetical protein ACI4K7_03925 [Oscillospiraceae bacterium]
MNISEMFSTTGGILFYGGIIGGAIAVLLLIVLIPSFSHVKRKLIRKIEDEYSGKKNG